MSVPRCVVRRPALLTLLAMLAISTVAVAPCACGCAGLAPADADTSLDADLHFALYAGGLDGFGQEPYFPMEHGGIQEGNQNVFAHGECEHPSVFATSNEHEESSSLYPHEESSVATPSEVALLHDPVCPLQDHKNIFHSTTSHNLSPIHGCCFPQILHSAAHSGHSHPRHPFSNDGSSHVVHLSNQNTLIQGKQQTTPAHNTFPGTFPESDTFHEIIDVIKPPRYDVLDLNKMHHNTFTGQDPRSSHNVRRTGSVEFGSFEIPQENAGNAQLIKSEEQSFAVHGLAQLPSAAPYRRQQTPPPPPPPLPLPMSLPCCSHSTRQRVVHDVGGETRVYPTVSGTDDARAMSPITNGNARTFEDYSTNIPLENNIRREVIPSAEISPYKYCDGDVANNGHHLLREQLEMRYQEVDSGTPGSVKTLQYRPFPCESVNHQKRSLDTNRENDRCQGAFISLSVSPTDSQTSIRHPENVHRETPQKLKLKSLTSPMISNRVRPPTPICIEHKRLSDVIFPRESSKQLQATNYHIHSVVHGLAGVEKSPSSVIRRVLNTTCSNNAQQYPILSSRYSSLKQDLNYLPSLQLVRGTQKKATTKYRKGSWSNAPESYKTPAARDTLPQPSTLLAEINTAAPRQTIQAPGRNQLFHSVARENFTVPLTLSDIPYDAFPYSESKDAEANPSDAERVPDESPKCGGVSETLENASRSDASNATMPADGVGWNGRSDEFRNAAPQAVDGLVGSVLMVPKVTVDVKIRRNSTEAGERSEVNKKRNKCYETSGSDPTKTGQENIGAVTTVSRLEVAGGGGAYDSSGAAIQLCRCEPGGGCTCSCVKSLCRKIGLRVAERVGEFVKKEAVSALKTLRDIKISD